MRLIICSAIVGVVLAGSLFAVKGGDSMEQTLQRRHAAIEHAVDGASAFQRH